mgnify:CR=1 FL=1
MKHLLMKSSHFEIAFFVFFCDFFGEKKSKKHFFHVFFFKKAKTKSARVETTRFEIFNFFMNWRSQRTIFCPTFSHVFEINDALQNDPKWSSNGAHLEHFWSKKVTIFGKRQVFFCKEKTFLSFDSPRQRWLINQMMIENRICNLCLLLVKSRFR